MGGKSWRTSRFLNRHSPLSCLHVVGIRRPVCEKQGSCPSNTKWVGFAWFLRNQPRACYLLRFVWFAGRRRRLVYNLQNIEFNAPSAFANAHSEKMIWPVLDPNDVLISCFEKNKWCYTCSRTRFSLYRLKYDLSTTKYNICKNIMALFQSMAKKEQNMISCCLKQRINANCCEKIRKCVNCKIYEKPSRFASFARTCIRKTEY